MQNVCVPYGHGRPVQIVASTLNTPYTYTYLLSI